MNNPKHTNSGFDYFFKLQKTIAARIAYPYSFEDNSLYRWRAVILSSVLVAAFLFGVVAFIAAAVLIIKENAWGLASVDILGLILCLILIFVHRIRFEIRSAITVLSFYIIGVVIILTVGPLSGGPAWLFTFAVLAGVLMGNYVAFYAVLMNAIFISAIGILIWTGKFGSEFPFFNTLQAMISAGVNFIVLNAITAVSVSALVKGLFHIFKKKEDLANHLEEEKVQLIETKQSLESEIKDRKHTEKALLKSETKYRLIYDNILDVYYESNLDGIILEISPSIEKHSQYKRKELIGKSLYDIYANPADREKLIKNIITNGNVKDYEIILTDKDGTEHICSMNIELIKDDKNNPVKLVGIFRDITERKQVEATLAKHRDHLELLVKQRTVELTKSNISLISEIKERKLAEERLVSLNKTLDQKVKKRTNDLKILNEHLIYAEEKERNRISVDLHDTVVQTLGFSVSKIKTMEESDDANNVEMLSDVQELIEQSLNELRQLINTLCPPVLKDFDIATAIAFLVEEINKEFHADMQYINTFNNSIDIEETKKITIYRAANELILNILKHSGVKKGKIELSKNQNTVSLKVEDNGIGFDMTTINENPFSSFGLFALSERCKNMGGNIKIKSIPGECTKAVLYIPLN